MYIIIGIQGLESEQRASWARNIHRISCCATYCISQQLKLYGVHLSTWTICTDTSTTTSSIIIRTDLNF